MAEFGMRARRQARVQARLQARHGTALAVLALLASVGWSTSAHALTYRWVATGSGNWSLASNWADGLQPPAGGDAATELIFGAATTSTATNDYAGNFTLNRLRFVGGNSALVTVNNANAAAMIFDGPGAAINVSGLARNTLSSSSLSPGITLASDLTIEMQSLGSLTVKGPIVESGGAHGITIRGTEVSSNLGQITLFGNNAFSGGITLESGHLVLNNNQKKTNLPWGTGPITINGGLLSFSNEAIFAAQVGDVNVNADLRLAGGPAVFNGTVAFNKPDAAVRIDTGTFTFNTAVSTQGLVRLGGNAAYAPSSGPATLTLAGAGGALTATQRIELLDGATLTLDDTASNLADRVNDGAALRMNSATLSLRANAAGSFEALRSLQFNGYTTLEVQPGSGGASQLALAALTRDDHGVLFVRGKNMGQAPGANGATIALVGGSPAAPGDGPAFAGSLPRLVGGGGGNGTTTISIVPWAVGLASATSSTGNANSFVTYGVNGFRPLDLVSEYAGALGSDATQNVRLTASVANDGAAAVNALLMSSSGLTIAGAGSIAVASGAVMNISTATIANALSFGNAEAVFTMVGGRLSVNAPLTGSGGLTTGGAYGLALTGDNSGLTGQLTINGTSRVEIADAASLPGTGAVHVYAVATTGGAGIGVQGQGIDVGRDIVAESGLTGLTTLSATSDVEFSGRISGGGSVNINSSGSFGRVTLSGDNSYAGITRINAGTLRIASDANLGQGMLVLASNSNNQGLELAGDWTTSRQVNALYRSAIQTHEHDAVLGGALTGTADLYKWGSGTLTLNADSPYYGTLNVWEGAVVVNAQFAGNVAVDGGALGGSGRVGDLLLAGVLAPGSAANPAATLSASSLTVNGPSVVSLVLGAGSVAIDNAFSFASGAALSFLFTGIADGVQAGSSVDLITFGSTNLAGASFNYQGPGGLQGAFALSDHALSFNVSAVPEPGTYALWLAGLGAVGFVAVRRRRAPLTCP